MSEIVCQHHLSVTVEQEQKNNEEQKLFKWKVFAEES